MTGTWREREVHVCEVIILKLGKKEGRKDNCLNESGEKTGKRESFLVKEGQVEGGRKEETKQRGS